MSLSNKVAIVTGGSSGIGAAIAEKFAEEGARVAIVGRNQSKLSAVAQRIQQKGPEALIIAADVSNEDDARRIIADAIKHFGKLDILVNNAGFGGSASILADNAMEQFDSVMSTNLRAVVHLTHLAAPHLIETKGNIINISSVAALSVFLDNMFIYGTSKAGLDHFSRCVARELAPKGVRVNTINPGPVKTDFLENAGLDEKTKQTLVNQMEQLTALKRVAEAEEIGDLALFIASDKARSITGASYVSDNGALLL